MTSEFDLIERYLAPLAKAATGSLGLRNDAAVLTLEPGRQLVVTADAMVEGIHFLPDTAADLVARKLLRVNLSDLAAMGAVPAGYLLTAALPPERGEKLLSAMARGLAVDQAAFGVGILGGDTVSTPGPITLSMTALGVVEQDQFLQRGTARSGDTLFMSGTLGDAALGLLALTGELGDVGDEVFGVLAERYHLPEPRLGLGQVLAEQGLATAAIDISDGLVADLGHLATQSGLGAEIHIGKLPLSDATRSLMASKPALQEVVLTGGDDYELLFAVDADATAAVESAARKLNLPITKIGRMTPGSGVRVQDEAGQAVTLGAAGWNHFDRPSD